eukprot:TRINITY_DN1363_c0_g1_i2.p1 TRINITY_DN1363_c0_g1~~TRINITY_DN1363_c0_g1_i2.p1  ORF type:complete len:378 (-),score=117.18 TRINITY_DN1363_c0_g1_i2:13-1095(-)
MRGTKALIIARQTSQNIYHSSLSRNLISTTKFLSPFQITTPHLTRSFHSYRNADEDTHKTYNSSGNQNFFHGISTGGMMLMALSISSLFTPGKGEDKFRFETGSYCIPHPAKRHKGGEDAHFVSADGTVLGVADGVGGWAKHGVDPGIYSKALMEGAKLSADSDPSNKDPLVFMRAGYEKANENRGSSTCCIVSLDGSKLHTANLGDSGFMVVRDGKMIYRSKEQQHRFNYPYQLGSTSRDKPDHSDISTVSVQAGDVVILGTDGLFDNMYNEQILSCLKQTNDPVQLSMIIADIAFEFADMRAGSTPFTDAAAKAGVGNYDGGKMDDITVVVGVVHPKSDNNNDKASDAAVKKDSQKHT